MEKTFFITITGISNYYGKTPFEIGRTFRIIKEPDNQFDKEAIVAALPYIGKIGYVANSTKTVYDGTISAGRLYDKIGDYAYGKVLFVTHSSAIAIVLSPDEVEEDDDVDKETDSEVIEEIAPTKEV